MTVIKLVPPAAAPEDDPEDHPDRVLERASEAYDKVAVIGYGHDGLLHYDHSGLSAPELVWLLMDAIESIRRDE